MLYLRMIKDSILGLVELEEMLREASLVPVARADTTIIVMFCRLPGTCGR